MAPGGWGIGRLALWLELRKAGPSGVAFEPPHGQGPIVVMHVAEDAQVAAAQVQRRLLKARPDLHILRIGEDLEDPGGNLATAEALIAAISPTVLLLLGSDFPAALVTAARNSGLPVILAEARLDPQDAGWSLRGAMRRELLRDMQAVLVTDAASQQVAYRMGARASRVVMTGPVAEIRDPLPCSEGERSALAELLSGRHAWFAASIPEDEEQAVIEAHQAALRQSHRALLFLAPLDADRAPALAEQLEASGLNVAQRQLDEDPMDDIHVMITDGPTEMGLWYRLAPVTYLGGTLTDNDTAARHPFEPAALGSAIVHGPAVGQFATEWQQLQGASASRQVANAEELATAVAELTQPELIATLASNAWTVSTGGADVTMRICAPVLAALNEAKTT
ncbi:3-deoxy-D-manno-octulosonic acid transferase [Paracoccus caeni]|uniref:3-deoxy-D-manno-octulosonic acid transferase n=1 Tax=Paracoccus caeni TaxID=657651 RepID=A0A934SBI9_9RHOB|nr:glycosyltransferase N-terminal domain-containing protein [Paracoccus caeni]MBK4214688.1 3-deoxy-D-manno-octulosonic acid transferase [Paracoccus caeni]